jgi:pimeloyl-ACP methyl ester carboxylesterase
MKRILKGLIGLVVLAVIALMAWGYAGDRDPAAMRAKYAGAASQFVDIGQGLKIHARDEGKRDGPVLVLVHGSNASLHTWELWVARLGRKYRVISLDLPGHGLTGPDPARDYHYARFVAVLDQTLGKLGVTNFALGGNSMGGGVAWHYALVHPEKVSALILVDAAGAPQWTSKSPPIGFRLARMPVVREAMLYITPRSVIEKSLHQSISRHEIVTPAMVDRYWELLLYPGNRQATLDRFALVHNVEPASKQALAGLKMPTLILWGDEDALIPVSSATWFAEAIPQARSIIYKGVGHVPMEEMADKSAVDVDHFLSAIALPPQK